MHEREIKSKKTKKLQESKIEQQNIQTGLRDQKWTLNEVEMDSNGPDRDQKLTKNGLELTKNWLKMN